MHRNYCIHSETNTATIASILTSSLLPIPGLMVVLLLT
jgi:hypothetical protein